MSRTRSDLGDLMPAASRRLAARYGAEHHVCPGLPHWIIAEPALPQVGPPAVAWLERVMQSHRNEA